MAGQGPIPIRRKEANLANSKAGSRWDDKWELGERAARRSINRQKAKTKREALARPKQSDTSHSLAQPIGYRPQQRRIKRRITLQRGSVEAQGPIAEPEAIESPGKALKKTATASQARKAKAPLRAIGRFAIIAICLIAVSATGFMAVMGALLSNNSLDSLIINNRKETKLLAKQYLYEEYNPDLLFANASRINILVYGLDRDNPRRLEYDVFRPDTIFIASINLSNESIDIISVPRDTRMLMAGQLDKMDKINASFYWGGIGRATDEDKEQGGAQELLKNVKSLLGVNINYIAGVDMTGVIKIVNMIGGVKTDVHTDIYVSNKLAISKGDGQLLDGLSFLRYARYRGYAKGDIARIDVQQRLLKDLLKAAASPQNVLKLPKLISQAASMLYTDMDFQTMAALGISVSRFDFSNINASTIPGSFVDIDGVSYWEVNSAEVREFANRILSE
ncbi:MAG: LCP family protein [Eubacteriaceae bacterium]|nr:LCP family protein [Eubacteriaceae bacterium]